VRVAGADRRKNSDEENVFGEGHPTTIHGCDDSSMKGQTMVRVGAALGALAVAAGAFGAHSLDWNLAGRSAENWETGARYQMYHALALVLCGMLAGRGRATRIAAWSFLAGTLVFCGALYTLGLGGPRWFGAIAPFGGTLMILGWVALAFTRPAPPVDSASVG